LGALIAAPAVVRFDSIMPVKVFAAGYCFAGWGRNTAGAWQHWAEIDGVPYINGMATNIETFAAYGTPTAITADRAYWERALSPSELNILVEGGRPTWLPHKLKYWYAGDALSEKIG
jgi:hypothetical protein